MERVAGGLMLIPAVATKSAVPDKLKANIAMSLDIPTGTSRCRTNLHFTCGASDSTLQLFDCI
jgi:hypothetical protein